VRAGLSILLTIILNVNIDIDNIIERVRSAIKLEVFLQALSFEFWEMSEETNGRMQGNNITWVSAGYFGREAANLYGPRVGH